MEKKTLIRKEYISRRNELDFKCVKESSDLIFRSIIANDLVHDSKNVFLYQAAKSEVMTDKLFDYLRDNNVSVYYPKVISDTEMEFYRVEDASQLVEGYMGICEPNIETCEKYKGDFQPELIFVPGVVFDKNFNRMGYGKGYYDRYLEKLDNALKIGLCYSFQLLNDIPSEITDIKMDYIVTEKEIWKRKSYN